VTYSAYGYITGTESVEALARRSAELVAKSQLRLRRETTEDLHNFPPELLPPDSAFCFSIDEPASRGVEYLLDNRDFAPEAEIDLPVRARERIEMLVSFLETVCAEATVDGMAIALTDCDEIGVVKRVGSAELREAIIADWTYYSPSNVLYVVDTSSRIRA
jgi:hypothetical protein